MNVRNSLIVITILSVMAFAIPGQVGAAAIVKIGIVDLQTALNETTEGMAAKESLRQRHLGRQEEIDAKKAELDSLEEKLKSPVLSEDAQAELKQEYVKKRGEIIEYVNIAKQEEEKENQALSGRILNGLVEIAREIAAQEDYTIIMEKSSGGVIYSLEALDLTERIVKIYTEKSQAGETK
jgi:Skp family chaperone for outer membrane proteins